MNGIEAPFVLATVLAVLLCYAGLLTLFFFLLLLPQKIRSPETAAAPSLTLVIPVRNEAGRLRHLAALYGPQPFRTVVVNDRSSDVSPEEFLRVFEGSGVEAYVLQGPPFGKKAAIHSAVERADSEWILTVDADTTLLPGFLNALPALTHSNKAAWVLPLRPAFSRGPAGKFFDLEFIALQAVGLASARGGFPLLANGAAFLFRRKAYLNSLPFRDDFDLDSGDDVFTLHAVARAEGTRKIGAYTEAGPAAVTLFPEGYRALKEQRMRWVSKAGDVKSGAFKGVIWLVFFANFIFAAASLAALLTANFEYFAAVVFLKIGPELVLIARGVLYFRRADLLWWAAPAALLYPFFFLALIFSALMRKRHNKDKRHG